MANELNVIGLMNVQFAIKGDEIFVLEVNPRASRTVPLFQNPSEFQSQRLEQNVCLE